MNREPHFTWGSGARLFQGKGSPEERGCGGFSLAFHPVYSALEAGSTTNSRTWGLFRADRGRERRTGTRADWNRLVRIRMPGGVGGGGFNPRSYPIRFIFI